MSNEKNMLKCLALMSALLAALCSCGDTVLEGDGTKAKAIGVAARLAMNDSFTVEAWVKIDTDAGNLENVLWAQYAGSTAGRCDFFVKNGRLGMFIGSNTDAVGNVAANETLYATGTIPYGEWVHVAFSRDWESRAYAFYVNGIASGAGTSNGSMLHVRNMTIGGLAANVSENARNIVKGRLAEVRVWNRVRTADEIAADKNRRLSGGETELLVYLPLSETFGNTTEDYVSRERCLLSDNWEPVQDAGLALTATNRAPARAHVLTPSALDENKKTILMPDVRLEGRAFTIEGWIFLPALCSRRNDIAYQYPGTGRFSLEIDKNTSQLSCWFNGKNLKSSALEIGKWAHFALVRSGTSAQFYLNGEADTSTSAFADIDVVNAPFSLFLLPTDANAKAFYGNLNEVRIWRTARTQAEIVNGMMRRMDGTEEGLLGCWPLTEGAGTRILNRVTGVYSTLSNATESVWGIGTMPVLEETAGGTETVAALTGSDCTGRGDGNTSISGRNFTCEAWVYPRMYRTTALHHGSENQILRQYNSGSAGRVIVGLSNGRIALFIGASGWMVSESCVPLGRWSHIAVVRENDTIRFYLNGEPDGILTGKTTEPPPVTNLVVGDNSTENFDGALREIRVWDCVRSADEIRKNFRWSLRGTEAGLVAYWPMVTHDGTTLVNNKRGSSNGTLVAAWYPVDTLELEGTLPPTGTLICFR